MFRTYASAGSWSSRKLDQESLACVISHVIISDLNKNGMFIIDSRERLHYFHNPEATLFTIPTSDKERTGFNNVLSRLYGVNATTNEGKYVLEEIRNHVHNYGFDREVHDRFFFDRLNGVLYIFDRYNGTYALDGHQITHMPNGAHEVFFRGRTNRPIPADRIVFDATKVQEGTLVEDMIAQIPFSNSGSLDIDEQRLLLQLYVYSIPFQSILQTKPILTFMGEKGSGKSFALRSIGKFVTGKEFELTHVSDEPGYQVAAANNFLIYLDNIDKPQKWLLDALATTATGITFSKRKLYTDDEEITLEPGCFLGLTIRDAHHYREDVIDRMLVLNTKRLETFVAEDKLLEDFYQNLQAIWMEYMHSLNKVVRVVNAQGGCRTTTTHRMADWAVLSMMIGLALGYDVEAIDILHSKLDQEKASLILRDDPLLSCIVWWMTSHRNQGQWVTGSELHDAFKGRDGYKDRYKSAIGLGKRMKNIQAELKRYFDMEAKMNTSKKTWEYRFPRHSVNTVSLVDAETDAREMEVEA